MIKNIMMMFVVVMMFFSSNSFARENRILFVGDDNLSSLALNTGIKNINSFVHVISTCDILNISESFTDILNTFKPKVIFMTFGLNETNKYESMSSDSIRSSYLDELQVKLEDILEICRNCGIQVVWIEQPVLYLKFKSLEVLNILDEVLKPHHEITYISMSGITSRHEYVDKILTFFDKL